MLIRIFSILILIYLFLPNFSADANITIVIVLYNIFGLLLILLCWRYRRQAYSLFIVSILFGISYIERLNLLISEESLINIGGHVTTGQFIINYENIINYMALSTSGVLSIAFGILISTGKKKYREQKLELIKNEKIYLYKFYLLSIIRLIVLVSCGLLNIGVSGVVPEELPLKLTGILMYLNNIALPILSTYMSLIAIVNSKYQIFNKMVIVNILIGIIYSYILNTKGGLIYVFIPIVIYLTDISLIKREAYNKYIKYIIIGIIVLIFSYFIIDYKRNTGEDDLLKMEALESFILNYNAGKQNLSTISAILQSISLRITGGTELMGVMGSTSDFKNTIINLLVDRNFLVNELPMIIKEVYNINVGIDGNTSVGKSFGLFGLAYLEKSIFSYLLTLFIFGILIGIYESSIKYYFGKTASFLLSIYLVINIWEGGFDIFLFYLSLPIIIYLFNYDYKILKKI